MFRLLKLFTLFLLGIACATTIAAPPTTDYSIIDSNALIRTAPPELKSTGKRVPYGTIITVAEEKTVANKAYVRVHPQGNPKAEFGWIAKSNLGAAKEFDTNMQPEDTIADGKITYTEGVMAGLYHTRGKYFHEQAKALNTTPAVLAAVVKVECSGKGFNSDGSIVIRFENHIFWERWGKANKEKFQQHFAFSETKGWEGHQWRKKASDPWIACHKSQASEHEVLAFAKSLAEEAALNSASYGAGQIMGFNHKAVGYNTAKEMVAKFDEGIKPQLDAMIAFIKGNKKCSEGLKNKDYVKFAEGYNGIGKAAEYAGFIVDAATAYAKVAKGKKYAE